MKRKRRRRTPAERIDLGLALLSCLAKPGHSLSITDIAAWCGCSRSKIHSLEKAALKKLLREIKNNHPDLELDIAA